MVRLNSAATCNESAQFGHTFCGRLSSCFTCARILMYYCSYCDCFILLLTGVLHIIENQLAMLLLFLPPLLKSMSIITTGNMGMRSENCRQHARHISLKFNSALKLKFIFILQLQCGGG